MTPDHVARSERRSAPLAIAAQGSFAVGGAVTQQSGAFDARHPMNPAGQKLHGDHARVTFQIPVDARPLPLLFWHGWWVDSSCWDTTPDGREGFRTLFLRHGYSDIRLPDNAGALRSAEFFLQRFLDGDKVRGLCRHFMPVSG